MPTLRELDGSCVVCLVAVVCELHRSPTSGGPLACDSGRKLGGGPDGALLATTCGAVPTGATEPV